jgi:hypothetical protein
MKKKDILYILTTKDAQNVAEETIGRKLTKKELKNVKRYFEKSGYPGWYEDMEEIISEVKQNKNS